MRILLADDHDLLREMIVMFLQTDQGIEVSTAADFDEARRLIVENPPFDLILLDYNMPGMNGLDGLTGAQQLTSAGQEDGEHGHQQRVALISGEASREIAERAIALGAAGFIPKTLSAKSLLSAVKFMVMGETYIPLELVGTQDTTPPHPLLDKLSTREREVLDELILGKSNKEIARELSMSEPTVKLHLKNLFRKIGATNRTQAALIGREAVK